VLAVSSIDALRDGEGAVALAELALATEAKAPYLDTLAAARAELGDFTGALEAEVQAAAMIKDAGRTAGYHARADLYAQSQLYRVEATGQPHTWSGVE
jgi:hypothetical protein